MEEVKEIEEAEEEKVPKEILDQSIKELSNEMIEFVQKECKDVSEVDRYLREAQEQFWLEKGLEHKWGLDPKIRLKIKKIENTTEKHFLDLIREKEKEILPKLIEDCIGWCRDGGLTKLTKTNVKFFLNERGITLTSVGQDTLYLKVNHELKKK